MKMRGNERTEDDPLQANTLFDVTLTFRRKHALTRFRDANGICQVAA